VERLVDPRIGPLLHHLLQLPFNGLGNEHTSRVRPNIYGGTERHGASFFMFPDEPDLKRRSSGSDTRMRSVLELLKEPSDDEGDLLTDVDRVVGDPLDRPRSKQ